MKYLFVLLGLVSFAFQGTSQSTQTPVAQTVSFTLLNKSLRDIPLKIPGYMNPNLSPMSNSGVTLNIGQEVYFQNKGKKTLLLIADASLEGKSLVVNKLIKEKKKELNQKRKIKASH